MPNPTTAQCRYCSRTVVEAGRNWTHLDGTHRCAWPFTEPGLADPAPDYAAVLATLRDAVDEQAQTHGEYTAALTLVQNL